MIGLALGRPGDPRIRSLHDPEAYVEVPAGVYPFGERGETFKLDAPFRIGRYPVTDSQFAEFSAVGGYDAEGRRWWSDGGWQWLHDIHALLQKRPKAHHRIHSRIQERRQKSLRARRKGVTFLLPLVGPLGH